MICLVAGDSIAQGLGSVLQECRTDAKIGIPSGAVVPRIHPADVTVISAGSNDPLNPNLEFNLKMMRAKCTGLVIWVLPIHPVARSAVAVIARKNNDFTVSFIPAKDNVHPRSYIPMRDEIRNVIRSLSLNGPT